MSLLTELMHFIIKKMYNDKKKKKTVVYIPQQNSIAKRTSRTLVERIKLVEDYKTT